MKNPYPILLLLPLLLLLGGCNAIAIWLYGLDTKFVPAHDDNREKVQARFGWRASRGTNWTRPRSPAT